MRTLSALGFVAVGLAACGDSGAPEEDPGQPGCRTSIDRSFAFNYLNGQFTLRTDDIELIAGGEEFHEQAPDVLLSYNPGESDATFELSWYEREQFMALNMYFTTDGSDWWADEIRTTDPGGGEWITYTGEFFRCPLGQYFSGSVELTADQSSLVPGSLRFDQLWLRAFVGDEPPGAIPTEIEALSRPACLVQTSCGHINYMNSCVLYWHVMGPAIRVDTLAAVTECIAGLECTTFDDDMLQCWEDVRPQPLPYHDEFLAACNTRTETCTGAADYSCNALAWIGIDLPYYSEELVAAFAACIDDAIPCEQLDVNNCMEAATIRHNLGLW